MSEVSIYFFAGDFADVLRGPADWRTLLVKWGTEDDATDWMRARVLKG